MYEQLYQLRAHLIEQAKQSSNYEPLLAQFKTQLQIDSDIIFRQRIIDNKPYSRSYETISRCQLTQLQPQTQQDLKSLHQQITAIDTGMKQAQELVKQFTQQLAASKTAV